MKRRAGGALLTAPVLLLLLLTGCAMAPAVTPKPPAGTAHSPAPPVPVAAEPQPASDPAPVSAPEPQAPKVAWVVDGHWGPVYTEDPVARGSKVAVLTFDDGPSPEYTGRVLDTLKEHGAKAIFFVNGQAADHPDLIRRIVAEGHTLANHTMTHENLRNLSREEQYRQIADLNASLKEITGEQPYWFRAPFGAFNDATLSVLEELGMQLLNWSHGSGDWMEVRDGYKDPAILTQDVLAETPRNANMTPLHAGAVILFHDTLKHTADALPEILAALKAKGYTFVIPEPLRS